MEVSYQLRAFLLYTHARTQNFSLLGGAGGGGEGVRVADLAAT
jgi:hypothetical protein